MASSDNRTQPYYLKKRALLRLQPPVCGICDEKAQLTLDHVIPRCRGGSDSLRNLWLLCQPCNSRKLHWTAAELAARGWHRAAERIQQVQQERTAMRDADFETLLNTPPLVEGVCLTLAELDMPLSPFGIVLQRAMKTAGISETQLRRLIAQRVGSCAGWTIPRWLHGTTPTPKYLKALCDILQVKSSEFPL